MIFQNLFGNTTVLPLKISELVFGVTLFCISPKHPNAEAEFVAAQTEKPVKVWLLRPPFFVICPSHNEMLPLKEAGSEYIITIVSPSTSHAASVKPFRLIT